MNLRHEYGIGANAREFSLFFGLSLDAKNDFQIQKFKIIFEKRILHSKFEFQTFSKFKRAILVDHDNNRISGYLPTAKIL